MARKTARPGRTLGVFFIGLAIAYGLVALAGTWKPELGLDLQGGTRITADRQGRPDTEAASRRPRKIIDQRVNGSGVAEAEVTVQGNRFIVVEIPGESRRDLVDTVKRQAQLRFRWSPAPTVDPGPAAAAPPRRRTRPQPDARHRRRPRRPAPTPGATAPRPSPERRQPRLRHGQPRAGRYSDGEAQPRRRRRSARRRPSAEHRRRRARRESDADRRPGTPSPEGGADVDDPLKWMDSPEPGGDRRPTTSSSARHGRHAGQRRGRPGQAAGHLRVRRRGQVASSTCCPPSMIEGTELDSRRRRHPAEPGQLRRHPRLRRRAAPRRSPRSPGRWSAPRSSSRSCSTARCCPRRRWTALITNGQAADRGQLHPGRGQEPGHQPQVRRAADRVRGTPQRRDRRPLAGR